MGNSHSLRLTPAQFKQISDKGKRPKYGNKKKLVNGIEFDSTKEALRYQDLALMQQAGRISDLRRQVPFEIRLNHVFICEYFADFTYVCNGDKMTEDVKGHKTDIYRLKKRLVEAQYSIRIVET